MFRRLEKISLEDLWKEVSSYRNTPEYRERCLDILQSPLERDGPLEEAQATLLQEAHGEPDPPGSSATGTVPKIDAEQNLSDDKEKDAFAEYLPHLTFLRAQVTKQEEQISELQQSFAALMSSNIETRRHSQSETQHSQDVHHADKTAEMRPRKTKSSVDILLERRLYPLTSSDTQLKKINASAKSNENKDNSVKLDKPKDLKDSSKKSKSRKRKKTFCSYCHTRGHMKTNCSKLKKKAATRKKLKAQALVTPVAAVEDSSHKIIVHNDHVLNICEINGTACKLTALINSGSPVSFIRESVYNKFFLTTPLKTSPHSYKALNDGIIKTRGFISSFIKLDILPHILTFCDLHVLNHNSSPTHILLGRDFLKVNKLFYGIDNTDIDNTKEENNSRVKLFSFVASADNITNKASITDFPTLFSQSTSVPTVKNDYVFRVKLKDNSYAYFPRKSIP